MKPRDRTFLVSLVIVVVLAALVTYWIVQRASSPEEPAPAVQALSSTDGSGQYQDINGNPVSLDDYLGRVLVVSSWASWCPLCQQTLPTLARLGSVYDADQVVVLAINRAEPPTTAQAYLRSLEARDGLQLLLDPADRYYESIEGYAMPETLVYDASGNVVAHLRGNVSYESLVRHVDAAQARID